MRKIARDKLMDAVAQEKASREWELSKYTTDELKEELESRLLEQNLYARKDTIDFDCEHGNCVAFDTENEGIRVNI